MRAGMNDLDAMIERIRAPVRHKKIRQFELAARAGIARNTLNGMMRDSWRPSRLTIEKLLGALDDI